MKCLGQRCYSIYLLLSLQIEVSFAVGLDGLIGNVPSLRLSYFVQIAQQICHLAKEHPPIHTPITPPPMAAISVRFCAELKPMQRLQTPANGWVSKTHVVI
jgi:hypothetical protein